ncbi:hypothetical protein M9H77_16855 [Catharanthus roseus]|uniref:Uncharacterized protein n=1 Tax=Catharanthus roseus TaxID=4058 RepID=A0ACC0B2W9_CATRO|nr:hypothetical protein M9H77_16855 [Catharanthus roseus]
MEEVLAHVHPGPIVPDVLTRQHEHRSGLIWSGDHKMCFTDLQCRRFGRSEEGTLGSLDFESFVWLPYHDRDLVPSDLWRVEVPLICYEIYIPDICDTRLDLHRIQLRGNDHTYWGAQHASHVETWHQWRLRVRDGLALAVEILLYPNDEYIRWYRGITQTSMLQEVDDMASVTIIRRFTVSVGDTLGCTPSQHDIQQIFSVQLSCRRPREHVPDRGARGVNRGARRQSGHGVRGGRPPVPPFPSRPGHADPEHVEIERGEGSGHVERGEGSRGGHPPIDPFECPNLDRPSFSLGLTQPSQSPASTSLGFSSFRAPPPPGTASSSTPHQPVSQASSSDKEERRDDTDDVQHLRFGYRVGKRQRGSCRPTGHSCN